MIPRRDSFGGRRDSMPRRQRSGSVVDLPSESDSHRRDSAARAAGELSLARRRRSSLGPSGHHMNMNPLDPEAAAFAVDDAAARERRKMFLQKKREMEKAGRASLQEKLREAFAENEQQKLKEQEQQARRCFLCAPPLQPQKALQASSFFLLSGDNPFRLFWLNVVTSKAFEAFIIIVIFANCVVLALDDPTTDVDPAWAFPVDLTFAVIFSLEMVFKCIAYGFVLHEGAYLRSGWNRLDFLIVILSWLAFIPNFGNYSALKTFRVLRPLRSMNAVKELKILVNGLFYSFIGLANVVLLLGFIFMIFGVLGVNIWMGRFRMQCESEVTGSIIPNRWCSVDADPSELLGFGCPTGYVCAEGENPAFGFQNFDNVLWAFLTVFQIITFEGWPQLLKVTYQVTGIPSFAFFFVLILIGSFFVPNLALAVINDKFKEAQAAERADFYADREAEGFEARQKEAIERMKIENQGREDPDEMENMEHRGNIMRSFGGEAPDLTPSDGVSARHFLAVAPQHFGNSMSISIVSDMRSSQRLESAMSGSSHSHSVVPPAILLEGIPILESDGKPVFDSNWLAFRNFLHELIQGYPLQLDTNMDIEGTTTPFALFIIFMICLNTVVLAAQHHNQPQWLTDVSFWSNIVFTVIFALELVLVIIAIGPTAFSKDRFYMMDFVIVSVSIVELCISGSGVVSVFRALRLLRVLKLLRKFKSLRALVQVVLGAIVDTLYLNVVMLLFLFIGALLGMTFFGGKMKQVESRVGEPVRAHFDTFYNGFYTVFQVITTDNWVNVMWNAMLATNVAAALFFVALVVLGTYVILNLFLSIIIDSFDKKGEADDENEDDSAANDAETAAKEAADASGGDAAAAASPRAVVDELHLADHPVRSQGEQLISVIMRGVEQIHPKHLNLSRHRVPKVISVDGVIANRNKEVASALEGAEGPPTHTIPSAAPLGVGLAVVPPSTPRPGRSHHHHDDALDMSTEAPSPGVLSEGSDPLLDGPSGETDERVCQRCGSVRDRVLPSHPMYTTDPTEEQLHHDHCWVASVRVRKERVLRAMMVYVEYAESNHVPFTPDDAEILANQARKIGLFRKVDETQLTTWEIAKAEIQEEIDVVDLRLGEEQLGKSLLEYIAAPIPKEHRTNGGVSLFLFGPENPFRLLVSRIVHHPAFDNTILTLIVISSLMLALDNPRTDRESMMVKVLDTANIVFTAIFWAEMLLKWIAFGVIGHHGAYFRDPWNWLDCFIVFASTVSLILAGQSSVGSLRALRTLRALRPLRVINRNRGLKMIVRTLLQSMQGIVHVALLAGLNYLIFGILAVQFFGGKLYFCTEPTLRTIDTCVPFNVSVDPAMLQSFVTNDTSYDDVVAMLSHDPNFRVFANESTAHIHNVTIYPRWKNSARNFDNIWASILSLFQVSTGDDWADVMYLAIDAVSVTEAPVRDYHPAWGMFFLVFYVVGNFFMLNLFVGVVIYNFGQVKGRMEGYNLMTDDQKEWVEQQTMIINFTPDVLMYPNGCFPKLAAKLDKVVQSVRFELFIASMILLNVVVIAMEFYNQPKEYALLLYAANAFFVFIFVVEATLKLLSHGRRYFLSGWNRFDFFLVVISIVGLLLESAGQAGGIPINVGLLRVFRIFRIFRMLRLFKSAKGVQVLLETLWFSLPSIGNISVFMLIIYFVFAIVGMQLFAKVQAGRFLDDEYVNFRTFFSSLSMMFLVTTNEKWSDAMYDCMVRPPDCELEECGTLAAPIYFVLLVVMAAFVVTNLFIAIILDNFNTTMNIDSSQVTMADLHRYSEVWPYFDPDATGFIATEKLPLLLELLRPPLGISRRSGRAELLRNIGQERIPEHCGRLAFLEVLVPLARKQAELKLTDRDVRVHEEHMKDMFPELSAQPVVRLLDRAHSVATVGHYFAATYLAAAYKTKLAVRRLKRMRAEKAERIAAYAATTRTPIGCTPARRGSVSSAHSMFNATQRLGDIDMDEI